MQLFLFLLGLGLLLVPDVLLPALVVVALLVELDPEVEVGDQHEESNEPALECHRVAASHSRQGADVQLGENGDCELKIRILFF